MIPTKEYPGYLPGTPFNHTCTQLADYKANVRYAVMSGFLRQMRLATSQLWYAVSPHIEDSEDFVIISHKLMHCRH